MRMGQRVLWFQISPLGSLTVEARLDLQQSHLVKSNWFIFLELLMTFLRQHRPLEIKSMEQTEIVISALNAQCLQY